MAVWQQQARAWSARTATQQDFREPLKTRGMLYARAADSILYAITSDGTHRISFDHVVQVMKRTDRDSTGPHQAADAGGRRRILWIKETGSKNLGRKIAQKAGNLTIYS